jgi:hypothetical protein
MSDQLVIVSEEAWTAGQFGQCLSFFEQNGLFILDVNALKLDHARSIALHQNGISVKPGRIVLLELSERVPEHLVAQFHTYASGAGVIIAPEQVDLIDRIFLY